MYIEASDQQEGDKAQISTFPITASNTGACNLMFYYYMSGSTEGALNVYAITTATGSRTTEFQKQNDQGAGWKQAVIDLSHMAGRGTFTIMFEGSY